MMGHDSARKQVKGNGRNNPEWDLLNQLKDFLLFHFDDILIADEDNIIADPHSGQVSHQPRFHTLDPVYKRK